MVDTLAPRITISGNAIVNVEGATAYRDAGATATDNYDDAALLQSRIVTSGAVNTHSPAGSSYLISYNVNDTSGNQARTAYRYVLIIDTTPPVITLLGSPTIVIEAAVPYTDAGAYANDTLDITAAVVATNNVNIYPTSLPATFTVVYNAQDQAGNSAVSVTRSVTVRDTTPPKIFVVCTIDIDE